MENTVTQYSLFNYEFTIKQANEDIFCKLINVNKGIFNGLRRSNYPSKLHIVYVIKCNIKRADLIRRLIKNL